MSDQGRDQGSGYRWTVGEFCIRHREVQYDERPDIPVGTVTWVVRIAPGGWEPTGHMFDGIPIRVANAYYPIERSRSQDWFSDGADFRPFSPGDFERLGEKYRKKIPIMKIWNLPVTGKMFGGME